MVAMLYVQDSGMRFGKQLYQFYEIDLASFTGKTRNQSISRYWARNWKRSLTTIISLRPRVCQQESNSAKMSKCVRLSLTRVIVQLWHDLSIADHSNSRGHWAMRPPSCPAGLFSFFMKINIYFERLKYWAMLFKIKDLPRLYNYIVQAPRKYMWLHIYIFGQFQNYIEKQTISKATTKPFLFGKYYCFYKNTV